MTAHLMVGIDPGVKTGLAIWSRGTLKLADVKTVSVIQAMTLVRLMRDVGSLHSVTVEDARLRKWFGTKGVEVLQGAGSIKRECAIWQEFVESLTGVELRLSAPARGSTKLSAEMFTRITGWQGRTSKHARDAAMLVYQSLR